MLFSTGPPWIVDHQRVGGKVTKPPFYLFHSYSLFQDLRSTITTTSCTQHQSKVPRRTRLAQDFESLVMQ